MDFGFGGREFGDDSAEAECLVAEPRPQPVITCGRRVAFVEDEIDDAENGSESLIALVASRHFEWYPRFTERLFCSNDSLLNRGGRHEKRASNFLGRQSAKQSQCQCNARFGTQYRVTRRKDQSEQIVADIVVNRCVEIGCVVSVGCVRILAQHLVLLLDQGTTTEQIDRAILCSRHEPCARIVWNARRGPPFERDHQCVLRKIFGGANIADHTRQAGNQSRRLDAPHRVDRTVRDAFRPGAQFCLGRSRSFRLSVVLAHATNQHIGFMTCKPMCVVL